MKLDLFEWDTLLRARTSLVANLQKPNLFSLEASVGLLNSYLIHLYRKLAKRRCSRTVWHVQRKRQEDSTDS